jgi:protein-disulfide isomerase
MYRMSVSENHYLLPWSIIIAGIIIALAIVLSGNGNARVAQGGSVLEATVDPITEADHIRGPRDAEVYLIEFSDFRCGYCGVYHDTVTQLLEEYQGLAWVYRHTPYQPGGYEAAIASECVAQLGGTDLFWEFVDTVFADQSVLRDEWYTQFAAEKGLDAAAFAECQQDTGAHDALFAQHVDNAQAVGAQGTPYTVLLTKNGDMVKFSGALPIDRVRPLVDRAFESLK